LRENVPEHVASIGKYVLKRLRDIQIEHPILRDANGKELFIRIEFVRDRETKEPASEETDWTQRECIRLQILEECISAVRESKTIGPGRIRTREAGNIGLTC